ncbi:MAG: hypothetical protein WC506_06090 [Candidatus Micrarchaeia archaeon]
MSSLSISHIQHCAAYVVKPGKHLTGKSLSACVNGSIANLSPDLLTFLKPFYLKTSLFPIEISFIPENNIQTNKVRDMIHLIIQDQANFQTNSEQLAVRLSQSMDKRSNTVLLIILVGTSPSGNRLVLLTFPHGAVLSFKKDSASTNVIINVLSDAFSQESAFFKAATYDGDISSRRSFWKGYVEDKQAKQQLKGVSNYWIDDFLLSMPTLKSSYGTSLLSKALTSAISSSKNIGDKQIIVAAATTLLSQKNKSLTFPQIANDYLPASARPMFLKKIPSAYHSDPFVIDTSQLLRTINLKSVEIDNAFTISGPVNSFDQRVKREKLQNGKTQFTLTGKVSSTKLSTSRRKRLE